MGTKAQIVLMPGDGVGPEIVAQAVKAMDAVSKRFDVEFETTEVAIGGAAIDAHGVPLRPQDTGDLQKSRCGAAWSRRRSCLDTIEISLRPERGLLALRKGMGLFANLRPVAVNPALAHTSPIKTEIVSGTDLVVVRELTGGIYFGKPSGQHATSKGRSAVDTMRYSESEIVRVVRLAFELAQSRRKQLASVDKMNVLATSRLWREIVEEIAPDYPDVTLEHVLVDAMSMRLVRQPSRFDVIVMENMFGDILTDEASVLAGSIGLLPSASIGAPRSATDSRRRGVYEPIHGSAPAMTGQQRANPVGTILSLAMLLRTSLGMTEAGDAVEQAVNETIAAGVRTPDIAGDLPPATTDMFGDEVAARI